REHRIHLLGKSTAVRRVVEYSFEVGVVFCTSGFDVLFSTIPAVPVAMSEAPPTVKDVAETPYALSESSSQPGWPRQPTGGSTRAEGARHAITRRPREGPRIGPRPDRPAVREGLGHAPGQRRARPGRGHPHRFHRP